MKNLKNELIKLGYQNPELRSNLRPILDTLSKTSFRSVKASYEFGGSLFNRERDAVDAALEWYYADFPEMLDLSDREIARDLKGDREGRMLSVKDNSGISEAFKVVDFLEGRV